MSGQTPKRPLRTRTADLTDFLRGNSHKDNTQSEARQLDGPSSTSDVPKQTPAEEVQNNNTGKTARRTFLGLGRTIKRKPSANSSLAVTTQDPVPGTFSKDFGDGHTVVMIASQEHPNPSTSSLVSNSQSFSSKIAARFTPSPSKSFRPRKANSNSSDNEATSAASFMSIGSLGVPSSPGSIASSNNRGMSDSRSITPTPTSPSKVTVSLSPPPVSPPELDLFEDLFTQSTSDTIKKRPSTADTIKKRPISVPAKKTQEEKPSFPSSISSSDLTRYPETGSGNFDSSSPVPPRLWTGSESRPARAVDESTPTEEKKDWTSAHKRKTLASMPTISTETFSSDTSTRRRSRNMPDLPGPPDIPLPPNPLLASSSAAQEVPKRTRASTMTSIKSATISAQEAVSRVLDSSPTSKLQRTRSQHAKEYKEQTPASSRGSSEELRQAVAIHVARFEELSAYLQTLTQQHTAEKAELQKRIDTLEKEARKREKEVKGLRWLVMNSPRAGGSRSFENEATGTSTRSLEFSRSRLVDSETEFESANASERSYPLKSSMKIRRPESGMPYLSEKYVPRQSSGSSLTPSPASSTSSLPSLTAASTASSALSAIPETPMVPVSLSFQNDIVEEQDARRANRTVNRISTSSMASLPSVSSATMSYASNLKRSRPPSIAQVLQQQQQQHAKQSGSKS